MRRILLVLATALLLTGIALAAGGFLPGGTAISVDITAPTNGAVKVYDPGVATLEGTAIVGEGLPVPNTALIYVLDNSGSTGGSSGGTTCGEQNPLDTQNNEANEIIDCEILAAINLNDRAVSLGTIGEVAMTIFAGSPATADATPAGGDDPIIAPGADANTNGERDVNEVLHSIWTAEYPDDVSRFDEFTDKDIADIYGTDFAEPADNACDLAALTTKSGKMVVFLSDGVANTGADITTVLPCGVPFYTFAVGSASSCDGDPNGLGSLQEMADLTGGTCTEVTDPASLPDILPGVITAKLLSLEYIVDGGSEVAIDNAYIDPDLPIEDPVSADFTGVDVSLDPGIHQICVRATGSDAGGQGFVEDCITVTIATVALEPATATNELGTPGQQHTVTATVAAGDDGGVKDVTVNFEVTAGPNAGASGSDDTDENGQAEFTYTAAQGLAGLGTDTIKAWFNDEQGDYAIAYATKDWVDTTPPVPTCPAGPNPGGKVPPAKGGQRPDGFYALTATDSVDPSPSISLVDTGSGTVFGPFTSVTNIKYTQARGATPVQKPMSGVVAWHITGTGDAVVYAVDASGNSATPVSCLVPPPPK